MTVLDKITLEKLQPHIPQLSECRVFLNGDCKLVWPVTFVYPEYQIMDFIQEFIESDMLIDQIRNVFEMLPEWDTEKKYKANEINVYFENRYGKIVSVDTNDVLGTILQHKELVSYFCHYHILSFPRLAILTSCHSHIMPLACLAIFSLVDLFCLFVSSGPLTLYS